MCMCVSFSQIFFKGLATQLAMPLDPSCKKNGPLAHLPWILVFDDQHNQIGLMNLQVIVL